MSLGKDEHFIFRTKKGVHKNKACLDLLQDFLLQGLDLRPGEAVGLGDDRHDADLGAQLFHHLHVQGLEAVAVRVNEVEAAVDPVVHNVLPVQAGLVAQVTLKLLVNVPALDLKISIFILLYMTTFTFSRN